MSLIGQVSDLSEQENQIQETYDKYKLFYFSNLSSAPVLALLNNSSRFKSEVNGATNSSLPTFPTLPEQVKGQVGAGLLVVDSNGRMISLNRKFIELWSLPKHLIVSQNDEQALQFVSKQFEDPERFLKEVSELYKAPHVVIHDTIKRKVGELLERYSQPILVEQRIVGRLWRFHEMAEFK